MEVYEATSRNVVVVIDLTAGKEEEDLPPQLRSPKETPQKTTRAGNPWPFLDPAGLASTLPACPHEVLSKL